MSRMIGLLMTLLALTASAADVAREARNPTTVCNPIDLEYMFHRGKVRADGKLEDLFVVMSTWKGKNSIGTSNKENVGVRIIALQNF